MSSDPQFASRSWSRYDNSGNCCTRFIAFLLIWFRRLANINDAVSITLLRFYSPDLELAYQMWLAKMQHTAAAVSIKLFTVAWIIFIVQDILLYPLTSMIIYRAATIACGVVFLFFQLNFKSWFEGSKITRPYSLLALNYGVFILVVMLVRGLSIDGYNPFSPAFCLWIFVVSASLSLPFVASILLITISFLICALFYLILFVHGRISSVMLFSDGANYLSIVSASCWGAYMCELSARSAFVGVYFKSAASTVPLLLRPLIDAVEREAEEAEAQAVGIEEELMRMKDGEDDDVKGDVEYLDGGLHDDDDDESIEGVSDEMQQILKDEERAAVGADLLLGIDRADVILDRLPRQPPLPGEALLQLIQEDDLPDDEMIASLSPRSNLKIQVPNSSTLPSSSSTSSNSLTTLPSAPLHLAPSSSAPLPASSSAAEAEVNKLYSSVRAARLTTALRPTTALRRQQTRIFRPPPRIHDDSPSSALLPHLQSMMQKTMLAASVLNHHHQTRSASASSSSSSTRKAESEIRAEQGPESSSNTSSTVDDPANLAHSMRALTNVLLRSRSLAMIMNEKNKQLNVASTSNSASEPSALPNLSASTSTSASMSSPSASVASSSLRRSDSPFPFTPPENFPTASIMNHPWSPASLLPSDTDEFLFASPAVAHVLSRHARAAAKLKSKLLLQLQYQVARKQHYHHLSVLHAEMRAKSSQQYAPVNSSQTLTSSSSSISSAALSIQASMSGLVIDTTSESSFSAHSLPSSSVETSMPGFIRSSSVQSEPLQSSAQPISPICQSNQQPPSLLFSPSNFSIELDSACSDHDSSAASASASSVFDAGLRSAHRVVFADDAKAPDSKSSSAPSIQAIQSTAKPASKHLHGFNVQRSASSFSSLSSTRTLSRSTSSFASILNDQPPALRGRDRFRQCARRVLGGIRLFRMVDQRMRDMKQHCSKQWMSFYDDNLEFLFALTSLAKSRLRLYFQLTVLLVITSLFAIADSHNNPALLSSLLIVRFAIIVPAIVIAIAVVAALPTRPFLLQTLLCFCMLVIGWGHAISMFLAPQANETALTGLLRIMFMMQTNYSIQFRFSIVAGWSLLAVVVVWGWFFATLDSVFFVLPYLVVLSLCTSWNSWSRERDTKCRFFLDPNFQPLFLPMSEQMKRDAAELSTLLSGAAKLVASGATDSESKSPQATTFAPTNVLMVASTAANRAMQMALAYRRQDSSMNSPSHVTSPASP